MFMSALSSWPLSSGGGEGWTGFCEQMKNTDSGYLTNELTPCPSLRRGVAFEMLFPSVGLSFQV